MKSLNKLPFYLSILLINSGQVLAIPARIIYSQDAQGIQSNGVELSVWRGYGTTINFLPTGEIIKQVWIGDPSRIGFTSNGNLCPKDVSQECNGGATVLFLRQIQPIKFPNLTSSGDGSTQITILTSGADGQKQYQFKLIMADGQPEYTSLVIKPDSQRPAPLLLTNRKVPMSKPSVAVIPKPVTLNAVVAESTTPKTSVTESVVPITKPLIPKSIQRDDANVVVYGLTIARQNGQIKPRSATWRKVQNAIKLLRQGKSREEAVSQSGVPVEIFNKLIEWGTP